MDDSDDDTSYSDYDCYDEYYGGGESLVLSKCGGRFLYACKDCYHMEPRVITNLAKNGSNSYCPCCTKANKIFLHETTTLNGDSVRFHEYQAIRERKSDHDWANLYCRYRNHCNYGEECRFVHTFLEMVVWQAESHKNLRYNASRWELVEVSEQSTHDQWNFHCPYCCRNFENHSEYFDHLKTKFHLSLKKLMSAGRDDLWHYEPCSTYLTECQGSDDEDDCSCSNHSDEKELAECKKRSLLMKRRLSYKEEAPSIDYLAHIQKRMQSEQIIEMKNHLPCQKIEMTKKELLWTVKFNLSERWEGKFVGVSVLQPAFKIKREGNDPYVQHFRMLFTKSAGMQLSIRFENPKIFGQHSGILTLDYGQDTPVRVTQFTVMIEGSESTVQSGICTENLKSNRFVIFYPDEESAREKYVDRTKELEKKYEIPESLDEVYLENLTTKTYVDHMHNFLYKEESARQCVLSRLNIECQLKLSSFISISGLLKGSKNDGSLFGALSCSTRFSTDSDEGILVRDNKCSKVLVAVKEGSCIAYECKVETWENDRAHISMPARCVSDLKLTSGSEKSVIVQFLLDRTSFCLRHHAIDSLGERISLICPQSMTYAKLNNSASLFSDRLDDAQNKVLNHINAEKMENRFDLSLKCFPPLVVAGPFGTGKTHTIRNVILDLLNQNGEDSRILLCTHSNSAADLYIKDIYKDSRWKDWTNQILRVMYHGRNRRTVLVPEVLHHCLFAANAFRYPTFQEIMKYRVVITTFSTSPALGQLGAGLRVGAFTHIFLDEASQAMEPEVIMPLTLASRENTRIIIAGDHRQINERMFLSDNAKIPTLLERMYNAFEDHHKQHRVLLCNNYRCVDGLLRLISNLFYKKGILKSTGDVRLLNGRDPVQFVHVQGECSITDAGDFVNREEAEQVIQQIKLLEVTTSVKHEDIMVSTPYYSQVQIIRDLLRKKNMRKVQVHTARNVQALQFKVILFSCVLRRLNCLSCTGKNFGFLSDANLLNTVLTRAKSLAIAIGDAVTLCSIGSCKKQWETFLEHCEASQTIHPGNIDMLSIRRDIRSSKRRLQPCATEFIPAATRTKRLPSETECRSQSQLEATFRQSSEEDDETGNEESDDDDPILADMAKKAKGHDPNVMPLGAHAGYEKFQYGDDEDGNYDPNEPDRQRSSSRYLDKTKMYPVHSVGELEAMLEDNVDLYKRCRIYVTNWYSAQAVELDDSGAEIDDNTYDLVTKNDLGRTFNQDEVVVEIIKSTNPSTGKENMQSCKVMGVLKRQEDVRQRYFLCHPDENNIGLMCPVQKSCTKFAIKTPKNHMFNTPGTVPIYEVKCKKLYFTELKLLSCEKVNSNCLYAVRYLEWSACQPFPLGYVEQVVAKEDQQKCFKLEPRAANLQKASVKNQLKSIKVSAPKPSEIVKVFTIDPKGARELDDALSIEVCKIHCGCFLLGIHVTDVASLIEKDSPIDREARRQGEAYYCSSGTRHMLPEELIAGKCSLLPKKLRRAISTYFHTSAGPPYMKAGTAEPKKSFVESIRQLTYEDAERLITNGFHGLCIESLDAKICKIWDIMWSWRVSRLDGAAFSKDFETYRELIDEPRARLLIEEAMLAVNANAANYLGNKGFSIDLRTQALPDINLWKTWLSLNKKAIEKSSCLVSSSNYIGEQHEEKRRFTRVPDSMADQLEEIPPSVTRSFRKREGEASTSDIEDGVEMYEGVWEDVRKCVDNGNTDVICFIAASDFLHPSLAPALEHFHNIQRKSQWVSQCGDDTATLHCSLRLLRYTRCSSPIRRYHDIVIQRCLLRALEGKSSTEDKESIHHGTDDCMKYLQYQSETTELAKKLREQPAVVLVCIAMVTDAGMKICLPLQGDFIPSKIKDIDYAHLMVDFEKDSKIFPEEENVTPAGDAILAEMKALWRFRFYDYDKFVTERATKLVHKSEGEEIRTVIIPAKQWQGLLKIMAESPQWNSTEASKASYRRGVKRVVNELVPIYCNPDPDDKMCGETRNNPTFINHHREIRKRLKAGHVFQIQLSSSQRKAGMSEPCLQLLNVSKDLEVCVYHNRDAVNVFAQNSKPKEHILKPASLSDYSKYWKPLIQLDAAYNAVSDGSSFIINGITVLWSLVVRSPKHSFELDAKFCRERFIEFHRNDLLCLRRRGVECQTESPISSCGKKNKTYTAVLHGSIVYVNVYVKDRNKRPLIKVEFKIFDQQEPSQEMFQNNASQWTVEIIPLSFMHRHMQISLRNLTETENELIKHIALKTVDRVSNVAELPAGAHMLTFRRNLPGFQYALNDKQQKEKNLSIRQKFTVIQGPPGTGKSYMGALIAANFTQLNKLCNSEKPKKVLYCGPSNKAVDVAARFLKDAKNLKVVRVYSGRLEEKEFPNPLKPAPAVQNIESDLKKPDEKLEDIALHHLIRKRDTILAKAIKKFDADVKNKDKHFTVNELHKYKAMVAEAKMEELRKCDVIVCTCSLSALLWQLKDENDETLKFSQCIIDECGMCSEPETMLPIIVSDPQQVVLIGDHKQLQPIIKCKKAERFGLGESLFSKFSHMAGMLTTQYRMDEEVMSYPSNAFYDGKLICDKTVEQRCKKTFFREHLTGNNIFWNVVGIEKQRKSSSIRGGHKSKYNEEEAEAVIRLLVYLTNNFPARLEPSAIMVLSPYTAQCAFIREKIRRERTQLNDVNVGTIITSQGSESEFVIISTVRSMEEHRLREHPGSLWEQKHLGFVCDPHQVNVALTRARRGLCIIGNKSLLEVNEDWKDLIKSYEERGAIKNSLSLTINFSPFYGFTQTTSYVDEFVDAEDGYSTESDRSDEYFADAESF